MITKMEDEDIDTWYDEQKEKLTDEYLRKIAKVKEKDKENLKKKFLKKLGSLRNSYEQRSTKNISFNLNMFFLRYRIDMFLKKLFLPIEEYKDNQRRNKKEKKE
jgi:hypothetical protein